MAYKLQNGKTVTIHGKALNGEVRAFVKTVIIDREAKSAGIVFKLYFNNKEFELENSSFSVIDSDNVTDYTDYFETESTETISVVDYLKKQAYKYINDKQLVVGSFNYTDWTPDEQIT